MSNFKTATTKKGVTDNSSEKTKDEILSFAFGLTLRVSFVFIVGSLIYHLVATA